LVVQKTNFIRLIRQMAAKKTPAGGYRKIHGTIFATPREVR